MAQWISSAFQKVSIAAGVSSAKPENSAAAGGIAASAFTDDPCLTCDNPCDNGHLQPPDSLAAKIDQTEPLKGTVKPYQRHLLVCAGTGQDWPERLEEIPDRDSFAIRLQEAVSASSKQVRARTILTACDRNPCDDSLFAGLEAGPGPMADGTENLEHVHVTEIISFPDFVVLQGLSADDAVEVVKGLITEGAPAKTLQSGKELQKRSIKGKTLILVCTHKKRDKRCGVIGPMLVDEVQQVVEEMKLQDKVYCYGVSHFGGHKFAGNLIIYSELFPYGLWYGRVKTCHIEQVIKKTVLEGQVFSELFRGYGNPPTISQPVTSW
ncbi:hypothetical protein HDU96_008666 [Phlyctochytrium bullatum]|nr:hypothetical protein HDU96_008666 [Phlyctochytrium bullatum]